MAGIGFELKKLFSRRGLFASFRAEGVDEEGPHCGNGRVYHVAWYRTSAGGYVFV